MSPLFGGKDEQKEGTSEHWRQALEEEFDRLSSLSLAQLGVEVMDTLFKRARDEDEYFTVAGPNVRAGPTIYEITSQFVKDSKGIEFPYSPTRDHKLQERITGLVAEGLQQLEHASLVRAQIHDPAQRGTDYALTRLGRVAVERGEVESTLARAAESASRA